MFPPLCPPERAVSSELVEPLVRAVHAGPTRLVVATTGGGSQAISSLLSVPGASRSILAATIPYSPQALVEWLGGGPDSFCAESTARSMAMAAYLKARAYDPSARCCGLACTASLASDRPKRGPHRIHLAYQTSGTTASLSVELVKGRRERSQEEWLAAALLLNFAAEGCAVAPRLSVPLEADESVDFHRVTAPEPQQRLLAAEVQAVPVGQTPAEIPRAILPGAFHPLHAAHRHMAALAGELLGTRVAYELSIVNVDKPPLDFYEISQRAAQFSGDAWLWLSRAPHFVLKAELFPEATFVVGADTITRVGDPRYYGGEPAAMLAAIDAIARRGCRFLVFGRLVGSQFRGLDELSLPDPLARICQGVPREMFREDLSSTELRAREHKQD